MKKTLKKSSNQNQMTFFELYHCVCGLGCTSFTNASITELHKTTMDFVIYP